MSEQWLGLHNQDDHEWGWGERDAWCTTCEGPRRDRGQCLAKEPCRCCLAAEVEVLREQITCDGVRQDIYDAIGHERDRQARLWSASHAWGEGDCSSPTLPPIVKSAVLAEECGEVARAVLEHDAHNLPRELIQVAAVAVAWLESM